MVAGCDVSSRSVNCTSLLVSYVDGHLQGYNKMLDKLNFKRDKIVDIQKAMQTADINQDKQLDFDEWRQDLKTSVPSHWPQLTVITGTSCYVLQMVCGRSFMIFQNSARRSRNSLFWKFLPDYRPDELVLIYHFCTFYQLFWFPHIHCERHCIVNNQILKDH